MSDHSVPALPWLLPTEPFPPIQSAWGPQSPAPGLLAAGGSLDVNTLVRAYRQGIFPWYSHDQPILWWYTQPRMVLQTPHVRLPQSLRRQLRAQRRRGQLRVTFDTVFQQVIASCASVSRPGQQGTWITPDMIGAYNSLHHAGIAHSVEVWREHTLVGGLYALNIGGMVYGESMFSLESNASKTALAALVAFCRIHGMPAIDCQQVTAHLASMGATPLQSTSFSDLLASQVDRTSPEWRFDDDFWTAVLGPEPA